MRTINVSEAAKLINSTNGRIFSVLFTKKNGRDRHMNCRLGVKIGVTGKGMSYNPDEYGLKSVFDMQCRGFRMINLLTIKKLFVDKQQFNVVEEISQVA